MTDYGTSGWLLVPFGMRSSCWRRCLAVAAAHERWSSGGLAVRVGFLFVAVACRACSSPSSSG